VPTLPSSLLALAVRSGSVGAHSDDELAEGGGDGGRGRRRRRRRRAADAPLLKSRDPHLAGAEQYCTGDQKIDIEGI